MAQVTWVLSDGTPRGAERDGLIRAIRAAGADLSEARVIPFAGRFDGPTPMPAGPVVCYGVAGLLRAGLRAGWRPAGWDGPGLGLAALFDAAPDLAWNAAAQFRRLSELRAVAAGM